MRLPKLLVCLLPALALQIGAGTALAESYAFTLADFKVSTVSLTLVNLSDSPASAPALPADATFTLSAEPFSLPPSASNTYLAASEGKFLRYTFDLPAGFYSLALTFEALVNDEFAVYINDTVVAIQASTESTISLRRSRVSLWIHRGWRPTRRASSSTCSSAACSRCSLQARMN